VGALKERLIQREQEIAEGRYPPLDLLRADPVKWEVLYTKIAGLVQNSKESAKQISASPIVREMGECIFALFTPEGDSVAFSTGLLLHIASIGSSIKWMLKNDYEEKVGIKPGDHFFNNDPYIGGAHSADQATVTPIFFEGRMIGWAGALTHCMEIGACEPGGIPVSSQTRFEEGLFWPCLRIAEQDQLKHDIEMMVERGTRVPLWWALDTRARMAGSIMIREGILEIVREYGVDYYLKAIYEFIESSRLACVDRIRTLCFPGRYRMACFSDLPLSTQNVRFKIDYLNAIQVEVTIGPDGQITTDFEGTSPAGLHSNNASLCCLTGNLLTSVIQRLFYDVKLNEGIAQASVYGDRLRVPDCTVNPHDITTACAAWTMAFIADAAFLSALGASVYIKGFREEVSGGVNVPASMIGGGLDAHGRVFAGALFEAAVAGSDASAVMDGLDTAMFPSNPEGDFTDAEIWEDIFPVVWLGRRKDPDGGGMGRFRGGNGIQSLYFIANTSNCMLGSITFGDYVFDTPGMMGAYPASANYKLFVVNTNLKEVIAARKPLPHSVGEDPSRPEWETKIRGQTVRVPSQMGVRPFAEYDLFLQFNKSGGGLGDPIDRDPKAVERDLRRGDTTAFAARNVYCVAVDPATGKADLEKTKELRAEMRAARLKRGKPAAQYVAEVRERILAGRIPPMPKKCINEILARSEKFRKEFRQCWGLPEEFERIP